MLERLCLVYLHWTIPASFGCVGIGIRVLRALRARLYGVAGSVATAAAAEEEAEAAL